MEKELINNDTLTKVKLLCRDAINNPNVYDEFIKPLKLGAVHGLNVTLIPKNSFNLSVLKENFSTLITSYFTSVVGKPVIISLDTTIPVKDHNQAECFFITQKNYTKDSYIVGEFNKVAYQAISNLVSNPKWGVMSIYGGVGVGKTHLLHCLAHMYHEVNKDKNVLHITSDDFIRSIYGALLKQNNEIELLKNYYNSVDLLLIDDIQFLSRKDKINEILFWIIEKNISNKKLIVLTSDKPLSSLQNIDERLLSRFASGLTVNIKTPDVPSIVKILQSKTKPNECGYVFPENSLEYIAKKSKKDIRWIGGILNQIFFYVSGVFPLNTIITIDILNDFFNSNQINNIIDSSIDPLVVIDVICGFYKNIDYQLLKSNSRTKQVSLPRNVCMYVLRKKFNLPLEKIGELFNKHHTSVIDSVNKISEYAKKNNDFNIFIDNICKKI